MLVKLLAKYYPNAGMTTVATESSSYKGWYSKPENRPIRWTCAFQRHFFG